MVSTHKLNPSIFDIKCVMHGLFLFVSFFLCVCWMTKVAGRGREGGRKEGEQEGR